jgi:hypothetical protein
MRGLFATGASIALFYCCGCGDSQSAPTACPAMAPQGGPAATGGDPCGKEGLVCSYGDAPGKCERDVAKCKDGKFYLSQLSCVPGPGNCPATAPTGGSTCSLISPNDSGSCWFSDGTWCGCACTDSPQCGSTRWRCVVSTRDATCPSVMPQLGAGCIGSLDCDYSTSGADGWHLVCVDGHWECTGSDCP